MNLSNYHDIKKTKCPICALQWEGDGGQQGRCIVKYGRCIVCLARDNPLKDVPWEDVIAYLRKFSCPQCFRDIDICTCNNEIKL